MVNSVKLKIFSVWPKIQPKRTEIIFSPYFHFKPFPPLSHALLSHTRTASLKASLLRPTHRAKRNDPHQRTTIAILPVPGTTPIDVDHDRDRADRCRSTLRAIAIAPIGVDRDHRNRRDCDRDLTRSVNHDRDLTIEIDEIAIAISQI